MFFINADTHFSSHCETAIHKLGFYTSWAYTSLGSPVI